MDRQKAIKFFKMAKYQASLFSKDPDKKVGAILLAPGSYQILSLGYNGFSRKVDDAVPHRWDRPTKYMYVEHAERNCVYNAARSGTAIENSIAVITMFPCCDCARALIQSGITTVITVKPDMKHPRWGQSFKVSMEMFSEVGMTVILLDDEEVA